MSIITGTEANDTLYGETTTDLIEGLGGNDYIRDEGGDNDIIRGNGGNDTIWVQRSSGGSGGLITIEGGAGDDRIDATGFFHASAYNWLVDAGDGDDQLELRYLTRFTANLGAGNDYLYVDMPLSGGTITLGAGVDRVALVSDYGRDPGAGDRYLTINGLGAEDQIDLVVFTYGMTNWDKVTSLFVSGHLRATQSGADVLIDVDQDGVGGVYGWNPLLRLTDRTLAQLSPLNLSGMPLNGGPIGLTYTTSATSYPYFSGTYGNDHITAGEGSRNQMLQGLAGDDLLVANDSGSLLWGGDGADHLIGGAGNDAFEGGLGDDVIEGGAGDQDVLNLWADYGVTFVVGKAGAQNTGLGWDTVTGIEEIRASSYADHLSVDPSMTGGVQFYASSGDDVLIGGVGNDRLYGEDGNDQVSGGDGDDTLDDFGDGADVYDGGAGFDTMSYYSALRGVTIDLTVTTPQAGNVGGLDVVLNIEGVIGSIYADTLSGTDQANTLWGASGEDILLGRGGDDQLEGGPGNDYLDGGDGDDTLTGGFYSGDPSAGENTLVGGAGTNTMSGGGGRDTFVVGKGYDIIYDFQVGIDRLSVDNLFVREVSEMIAGPADAPFYSEVYVTLSNGSKLMLERIRASDITSSIFIGLRSAVLGGAGDDTLTGTTAGDWMEGQGGADRLSGGDGDDTLVGGSGNDVMAGGAGDDAYEVTDAGDVVVENAGEGQDTVYAYVDGYVLSAQVETLILGAGAYTGIGNAQGNVLIGNGYDNNLVGGAGADVMIGGVGNDAYEVANAGDIVIESAGQGQDTVYAYLDGYVLAGQVETLVLGAGAYTGSGNALANVLIGNSANNNLLGGAGADVMIGGAGNDAYEVTDAGDVVVENAGGGQDTVYAYVDSYVLSAQVETLVLGAGAYTGIGNAMANVLIGNGYDNILAGGAGADVMIGGAGNDAYEVTDAGDVVIENAGQGEDTVYAYVDNYVLPGQVETLVLGAGARAGSGNALANVLIGNSANNTLTGGGGADLFLFTTAAAGKDVVTDFTDGVDRVVIDHHLFADFAAIQAHAAQVGDAVVITYDSNTSLTLEHFALANLTASDFLFA
jgi:Ca2+-binding RTX toxin-like protein